MDTQIQIFVTSVAKYYIVHAQPKWTVDVITAPNPSHQNKDDKLTLQSKVEARILVSSIPPTSAGLIFSKSFVSNGNNTFTNK